MKRTLWIERRFPVGTPPETFPGLLERLRGTPARLEERVRDLVPDRLTRRDGGRWSIQENAGHLVQVEPLWLGRLDDFAAGLPVLRPADMSNRRTEDADYNARPLAPVLAEFRASRAALVSRLEQLDDAGRERVARHPRLDQPMSVVDMMLFVAEHDDHHLARITEILGGIA